MKLLFACTGRNYLKRISSDMLFADKIIFVEGLAERLILPIFMERCGCPYEDEHIAIVEIGGKHFGHFISLFADNALTKKILCITDSDYKWIVDGVINGDISNYDAFKPQHVVDLQKAFDIDNLHIVSQKKRGRTFEDELFIDNIDNEEIAKSLLKLVMSQTMVKFIEMNGTNFNSWDTNRAVIYGRSKQKVEKLLDAFKTKIDALSCDDEKDAFRKLFFAELFLQYAENRKGEIALRILVDDNILKTLIVPQYIREGLEWLSK